MMRTWDRLWRRWESDEGMTEVYAWMPYLLSLATIWACVIVLILLGT